MTKVERAAKGFPCATIEKLHFDSRPYTKSNAFLPNETRGFSLSLCVASAISGQGYFASSYPLGALNNGQNR